MRKWETVRWGAVGLGLLLMMACTPKGSVATPSGQPTASPVSRFGPPAAAELASLPVQPRSGTWRVSGRTPGDKFTPFTVVLEFQPNGLIKVNGRLKTDEEAAKDPYSRDFVSLGTALAAGKVTVVFQLSGGQYTVTLTGSETMDGVGMYRGEVPVGVRLKWESESTTPEA